MAVMSIVEALREAIREEMKRNPAVFCLGEDIDVPGGFGGAFTVTLGLSKDFGHERILDTPISENGIFGAAVGAAIAGMRPIVDVQYGDFLFCAMDQICNQAAKMHYMSGGTVRVPMVMRAPVGATTRGAQHAQSLESFFCQVPGLKVIAPSTAYDAKGMMKAAIRSDDPVLVFEHKLLYGSRGQRSEASALSPTGEVPEEDYIVPFGKAAVRREGRHVTVIAKLLMVYRALDAAAELEKEGIEVEVMDPRSLVPFDEEALFSSIAKTHHLVIVEENHAGWGWGAEIAARVAEKALYELDGPVRRVAARDAPIPFAPIMESHVIPDKGRIIQAIREVLA